ncbi:MAG: hypothetical protein A2289_22030 [Deltaproteobacteria bacterium RIFOXYA12_FULL_58_15]|nr:MAG: hypothetical protein A2289_22030 [Deltaproteobacteria bacterium RIFOXYA12_FULL_58_15]
MVAVSWERAGNLLKDVEELMRDLSRRLGEPVLGPMALEHLATGGKRLRARLALAAVDALGTDAEQGLGWAAACELLHNATLIHDDIQDGDEVRRGHPTTWARHGREQAINVGDLMLLLPLVAVGEADLDDAIKARLATALGRHACAVISGQGAELEMGQQGRTERDIYVKTVVGKTSGLFELPVEGAAIVAGRSAAQAANLSAAFRPMGILFQMQDDVLDLYGDKGRGSPGSDIREGKISALVVEHLGCCPADRDWLLSLLRTPRDQTPDDEVRRAIERMRTSGALAAVSRRIAEESERIRNDSAWTTEPALGEIAMRLVDRVLEPVASVLTLTKR